MGRRISFAAMLLFAAAIILTEDATAFLATLEANPNPTANEASSGDEAAPSGAADDEQSAAANEDADEDRDESGETAEANDDEGGDEKDAPQTHEVERKDLKVEVDLEGAFVAEEMAEVALRPEVWSTFKVVEAVPHGQRVRKGEVLVEFDDRKFEQQLADRALDDRLSELALMAAEDEFPRLQKATELNFEQAERSHQYLVDEYDRFKEVVRPMSEKMAEQSLKSNHFYLESAREELKQLQQMYDADEITEETEEIVLKRQRFNVQTYELYFERAKINYDLTMNISLPRSEENYQTNLEASEISFDQAKMAKNLGLTRQRYELEQLREKRARNVEEHAKLVADRAQMKLRAPIDGVAYYGRCVDGKFSEVGSLTSKLAPYGTVPANTVVMTVVKLRPLRVEASVGEKDFPSLQKGQQVEVSPVADEEVQLEAKVDSIALAPGAGNKFEVALDVDARDAPEWLVPGMTCKAKVTTYEAKDAIVIPSDLVQSDADDDDKKYVMVLDGEEEIRRDLKLGESSGDEVEVLNGLSVGDKIVKDGKDDEDDEDDKDEQ
ncbi:MAG: HlyD family efflux transporter periplasmic adaptor subunit [Planctomycetota bacterium]